MSEQNTQLNSQLTEKTATVADLTTRCQQNDKSLVATRQSEVALSKEINGLHETLAELKRSNELLEKQNQETKVNLASTEMESQSLESQLERYKVIVGSRLIFSHC